MKKLLQIFKTFIERYKMLSVMDRSEHLVAVDKNEEALDLLLKNKSLLYGKTFRYHLDLGRAYRNARKDNLSAIQEIQKGISMLKKGVNTNPNDKEYILAWAEYAIGLCLYDLNEKEEAEKWRSESEKHFFDFEKIGKAWKLNFPMNWHVDCQ